MNEKIQSMIESRDIEMVVLGITMIAHLEQERLFSILNTARYAYDNLLWTYYISGKDTLAICTRKDLGIANASYTKEFTIKLTHNGKDTSTLEE